MYNMPVIISNPQRIPSQHFQRVPSQYSAYRSNSYPRRTHFVDTPDSSPAPVKEPMTCGFCCILRLLFRLKSQK